jgi:hypothetical protein
MKKFEDWEDASTFTSKLRLGACVFLILEIVLASLEYFMLTFSHVE